MKKRSPMPASLAKLKQRFADWRAKRTVGERIPDPLWNATTKAAHQWGINRVASTLDLDYYAVKKRVQAGRQQEGKSPDARDAQTFVELPLDRMPNSPPPHSAECVVEFAKASGDKMRIQLRGPLSADLVALAHRFLGR